MNIQDTIFYKKGWAKKGLCYFGSYEKKIAAEEDKTFAIILEHEYRFYANPDNWGKIHDGWAFGIKLLGSEKKLIKYYEQFA